MLSRLEELYEDIDNSDVLLVGTDSVKNPAMTLRLNSEYAIVMNEKAYRTDAERFVVLAHEKGHCDTGAVYSAYAPLITREQCERRANTKAAFTIIPLVDLVTAFECGATNVYELSVHFGVTEDFMRIALEIYSEDLKRIYREREGKL